ncbi:MAG: hypothetical protein IE933_02305 [Sphingomonadales bacterium]|nr:hypothetical protein [Sphingomonadales bacterium]MBD3772246.1 hypothetical protein [Paracoccaceae bacterium]
MKHIPLAVLALALAGPAQAADGEVVTHQTNAGTLDGEGFAHVDTVTGNLSLDMPCKFSEMSFADAPMEDGKSPYAKSATVLACSDVAARGGALVLRAWYDTGATGADHFFDTQVKNDAKKGKIEQLTFKGDRAFRTSNREDGMCRWKQVVRHGDTLVTLSYFARFDDCSTFQPKIDRYFNSLEITE